MKNKQNVRLRLPLQVFPPLSLFSFKTFNLSFSYLILIICLIKIKIGAKEGVSDGSVAPVRQLAQDHQVATR